MLSEAYWGWGSRNKSHICARRRPPFDCGLLDRQHIASDGSRPRPNGLLLGVAGDCGFRPAPKQSGTANSWLSRRDAELPLQHPGLPRRRSQRSEEAVQHLGRGRGLLAPARYALGLPLGLANSRRKWIKILFWDNTGWWVCVKRLEAGRWLGVYHRVYRLSSWAKNC